MLSCWLSSYLYLFPYWSHPVHGFKWDIYSVISSFHIQSWSVFWTSELCFQLNTSLLGFLMWTSSLIYPNSRILLFPFPNQIKPIQTKQIHRSGKKSPFFHCLDNFSCCYCLVTESYMTLCKPMDCSPPGFYVHFLIWYSWFPRQEY